jgi:hypothetical protein
VCELVGREFVVDCLGEEPVGQVAPELVGRVAPEPVFIVRKMGFDFSWECVGYLYGKAQSRQDHSTGDLHFDKDWQKHKTRETFSKERTCDDTNWREKTSKI